MNITGACVVRMHNGPDLVSLHTDLPSPFPPEVDTAPLDLTFRVTRGDGLDYVKKHFGIEAELIDTGPGLMKFNRDPENE